MSWTCQRGIRPLRRLIDEDMTQASLETSDGWIERKCSTLTLPTLEGYPWRRASVLREMGRRNLSWIENGGRRIGAPQAAALQVRSPCRNVIVHCGGQSVFFVSSGVHPMNRAVLDLSPRNLMSVSSIITISWGLAAPSG